MTVRRSFLLEEAARITGLKRQIVLECIQNEWIAPADPETPAFDEEDIARLRFIVQLRNDFGVNDEAVPIILHLLDQLLHLQFRIRRSGPEL